MLQNIPNKYIERVKWDELVSASPSSLIYGNSWYLDAVAPGWEILADEDYRVGLPLVSGSKYGQPFVYQPLFIQRFGVYQNGEGNQNFQETLFDSIPEKFRYVEFQIDWNKHAISKNYSAQLRTTQVLDLSVGYDQLYSNYTKGLCYSLRKFQRSGCSIRYEISSQRFAAFLKNSELYFGLPDYQKGHLKLMRLMRAADISANGQRWGVEDKCGNLLSVIYTIEDRYRIYYLFQCSSPRGREYCAAHALTDELIRRNAGRQKLLDFVGSNVPSIAFFNHQFGAKDEFYQKVSRGSRSILHCLKQSIKSVVM